ncbi:DoxX family membrane protein [Corallococcus sp. M34]|uniref:DoxX family membrane protein n=1 Tax=Citreicoccus inhibens TaxID=2849499 RepID=UPI001C23DFFF|nr:DoxX family membrane protein [Citreicoccus inhibens]MBU8896077.1 DoxX family membrane protein [Citreicoccus inhibens]
MTTTAISSSVSVSVSASSTREDGLERWAIGYARIALGVAFLSAVASRFGLWSGEPWSPRFERFIAYTAQVNAFAPAACIPFLAWVATLAETTLGTLLVLGLWRRHVAFASAAVLAVFGTAMAVSLGPKEPLDYSVYSASAGALLLALASRRK